MELQLWFYYTFTILILAATPGPNVLLGMTTSVISGFSSSLYTIFGGLIATLTIMTLSFTGLGVVVASSETLFSIIKYLGGFYLIYLGYKAITSKEENYRIEKEKIQKTNKISLFIKGFMVGASNPKAIVFFIALFPQFININNSMITQYIIFVSTFATIELSWLLLYSYLGHRSSKWFLAKGRAKFFNRITGSVFIGAGVLLSTSQKS